MYKKSYFINTNYENKIILMQTNFSLNIKGNTLYN